jgi:mannosyl-oligosaccharide glucosidase
MKYIDGVVEVQIILSRLVRKTNPKPLMKAPLLTFHSAGFDDYPRAEPPSASELHIDLISWMAFSTRLMKSIATHLGEEYKPDVEQYEQVLQNLLSNIDTLHWSKNDKAYCDVLLNDIGVDHICHKGYISLFPLILGLLPADSPKLGAILDLIRDENELWTPYGLRSLSAADPKFNTGENYWRGPIWMNVNYLTLQSLHNVMTLIHDSYLLSPSRKLIFTCTLRTT